MVNDVNKTVNRRGRYPRAVSNEELEYRRSIGRNLRKLRKGMQYTIQQMADLIRYSVPQYQTYERGKSVISPYSLYVIANHIGADIGKFYKFISSTNNNELDDFSFSREFVKEELDKL